jgi:hypothetical protein
VGLLLIAGLVIDAGVAFVTRRDAQNNSDLAAMAGVKVVSDHYTVNGNTLASADVFATIDANTKLNGCNASIDRPCSWTADYVDNTEQAVGAVTASGAIPTTAQGVIVHVVAVPSTYLLGLLGQATWTVSAQATALTAKIATGPPGQLLPIAINPPVNPYVPGQTYTLAEGQNGPGNFGWLGWTGSNSTKDLSESVCLPNNPAITFPVMIPGVPGAHNSKDLRDCLEEWKTSGATVLVPIFDICSPCNGNGAQYRVIGLAAFVITSFSQPAISQVNGRFVGYYSLPSVPAGGYGGPPSPVDPTSFIGLIR